MSGTKVRMEELPSGICEEIFSMTKEDISSVEKMLSGHIVINEPFLKDKIFEGEEYLGVLENFEKMILALINKRKNQLDKITALLSESEAVKQESGRFLNDIAVFKIIMFASINCRLKPRYPTVYIKEGFKVFSSPNIGGEKILKDYDEIIFEKL